MPMRCVFWMIFLMMALTAYPAMGQDYGWEQQDKAKEEDADEGDLSQKSLKDRLVFGGNVGLSFGTITNITVSPRVGYRMSKKLMAGLGGTYRYFKVEGYNGWNIYGASLFTNYQVLDQFVLLAEVETLNVPYQERAFDERGRVWQPGTFLGAAYRQKLGGKAFADLELKYNFSYRRGVSPYPNPYVINVAFYIF